MSAVDALRRSLEVPRADVLAYVGENTHWLTARNPRLRDAGELTRFLATAAAVIRQDPRIVDADPDSVLQALADVAAYGFELGDARGQAWLAVVDGRAQMRLGYRGVIDLAGRAGIILDVHDVHQRDRFEFWWGIDNHLVHAPFLQGDRGPTVAWWAIARFRDGAPPVTHVMSRADVEQHRDDLRTRGELVAAWTTHFDAMARRTVLLRLTNYLPLRDRDPQVADVLAAQIPAPLEYPHGTPNENLPEHDARDQGDDGRDLASGRPDRSTPREGIPAGVPPEEADGPRRGAEPPLLDSLNARMDALSRFNRAEMLDLAAAHGIETMRAWNGKTLTAKLLTHLPDDPAEWRLTPSGEPF